MKLRLWSIQEAFKLDEIKSSGKLICSENKYSLEWDKEYKWMIRQMNERIGFPKLRNQYPIWAWYQYEDSKHKKPDLRKSGHLPSGTNAIRIEFEKRIENVLLSDFILWHYPLSYKSIIAKNEEECEEFEARLKNMKLDKTEFNDLPIGIRNSIEISWQRVFDMDFDNEFYTHPKQDKKIQACCWDIKEQEIMRIDKFKAR